MNPAIQKAIDKLMARRKALQDEYDRVVSEPAAYGITGSVNATNRSPKELRDEIVAIDDKIDGLLNRNSVAGMNIRYPDYRYSPLGGYQ